MKALTIGIVVLITLAYWDSTSQGGRYTRGVLAMFRSMLQGFGF